MPVSKHRGFGFKVGKPAVDGEGFIATGPSWWAQPNTLKKSDPEWRDQPALLIERPYQSLPCREPLHRWYYGNSSHLVVAQQLLHFAGNRNPCSGLADALTITAL